MSCVSHGARLHLIQRKRCTLEGPDPCALWDALSRTDAVAQTRDGAGAQTHLARQIPQPLRDLWGRNGHRGAAGPHQPSQRVQGSVHGALAVTVVCTHVTACGTAQREGQLFTPAHRWDLVCPWPLLERIVYKV